MKDAFGVSKMSPKKPPVSALLHGLNGNKTPVRVLGQHTKDHFWVHHQGDRTLVHRSRLTFIKRKI